MERGGAPSPLCSLLVFRRRRRVLLQLLVPPTQRQYYLVRQQLTTGVRTIMRASCCCLDRAPSSSHHLRLLLHLLVLIIIVIISSNVALVSALHVDEVGITDYVLRTAGHGDVGVQYAKVLHNIANTKNNAAAAAKENDDEDGVSGSSKSIWITSQSEMCPRSIVTATNRRGGGAMTTPNYYSDCSIAARNIGGALIWRVNACAAAGNKGRHFVTLATNTSIYSLDTSGIFRIWDPTNGALQLDINILDNNYYDNEDGEEDITIITNPPRIFDLTTTSRPQIISIIGTTIMSKSSMGGVGEKSKKNKKKKDQKGEEEKYDDELLLLLDTTTTGLPISSTTYC